MSMLNRAVAALGCIIALSITPAQAAENSGPIVTEERVVVQIMESPDPQLAFDTLPEDEKALFVNAMKPVSVDTTFVSPSVGIFASNGCWNQTIQQDYRSSFGFTTVRMTVSSAWCAANGRISSHSMTGASGQAVAPGYSYNGISSQGEANHSTHGVSVAQGHFSIWGAQDWVPGTQVYACTKQYTFPGYSNGNGSVGGTCHP